MTDTRDDDKGWLALLGNAERAAALGDFGSAIRQYDEYIGRVRDRSEAYYKRAIAFSALGSLELSLADYDRAIALNPKYAYAYCNRGSVLERLGCKEDALSSYDVAISIDRNDYLSHYNRGTVLKQLERIQEALASFDTAIRLNPNHVEAHVNRGNILQEMGRHDEAIESFDRAIQLKPVVAEAFQGRAISLNQLKKYEAAIASLGEVLRLSPRQQFVPGARRYIQMQSCDWDNHDEDTERLVLATQQGEPASPPFAMLALIDAPEVHRVAAETWIQSECRHGAALGPIGHRSRGKKIRIGYFSADFRDHPVSQLTAELFEHHDRDRFEITAFAFGPPGYDSMRIRLERTFDRFIDVGGQTDVDIALLARSLEIDIAVDLGGLTEYSRTRIFANRAAPVQINFLGYPGTVGADYIDYVIADRTVVPESQQANYAEKIIYLPGCYLPSDSVYPPSVSPFSRKQLGLPKDAFVFCCFNNVFKITPSVFDSWMRILKQIDGSVIWLAQTNSVAADNLRREAHLRAIAAERLIFANRIESLADHRSRLGYADLFLDTFPYNAHATALDAIRAGLPILSRTGEAFAGKVVASLLREVGLPELIVSTPRKYEELAVALAASPGRLLAIKEKLRRNCAATQLFDIRKFAANLEAGYTAVFGRYSQSLPPEHIYVDS